MIALSRKFPFDDGTQRRVKNFPGFSFASSAFVPTPRRRTNGVALMRTNCGRERVRERACMERVYRGREGRGGEGETLTRIRRAALGRKLYGRLHGPTPYFDVFPNLSLGFHSLPPLYPPLPSKKHPVKRGIGKYREVNRRMNSRGPTRWAFVASFHIFLSFFASFVSIS